MKRLQLASEMAEFLRHAYFASDSEEREAAELVRRWDSQADTSAVVERENE